MCILVTLTDTGQQLLANSTSVDEHSLRQANTLLLMHTAKHSTGHHSLDIRNTD